MKEARTSLRDKLKTLKANSDEIIDGIYISRECGGHSTDVDNVLFYNVRGDYFKESSRNGLRFRYLAKEPPQPPESSKGKGFAHYQSYELSEVNAPFLNEYESAASYEFEFVNAPKLKLKEDIWWGFVNDDAKWNVSAEWKLKLRQREVLKDFALRADVRYPKSYKKQYVPYHEKDEDVFDGIASAMHVWTNQKRVDEVASCVAAAYQEVSCESVRAKLQNNNHAFLGKNNKQRWDPADDKCVAGELLLSPNSKDNWRFKVEILAIE